MSVEQMDVVDFISVSPSGRYCLTISDHLDWADSLEHQSKLQEKINRYLAFIEAGELYEKFPEARDVM